MPKKRAASPSRSPVAKRKRTVKATSTAPKATAPKKDQTLSTLPNRKSWQRDNHGNPLSPQSHSPFFTLGGEQALKMTDDESVSRPQDNERYSKTLDAIVAAPALSIRAVLFSLYAEGNVELKSLIEDRVSDFTVVANLQTVQNLNVVTTTTDSEETQGENPLKRKATEEPDEESEKKLCIHCEEEFDPEDEDDDGCSYHPGTCGAQIRRHGA
ncbi:hypothetical protein N0V85_006876 [Neurospora sp. IMI 360204]|nr:hypothetical protein N0V85_006876 [Neurospora sp. IMI 360204]